MIDLRFYTIIVRKDKVNDKFMFLFNTFNGPKNEDDYFYVFYTMAESILMEIKKELKVKANLKGIDNDGKWQDYVIVGSMQGILEGKCDWIKIVDNKVEYIG
ncbi:hypothetical protein KKH39_03030 [Patescibacteria group bacterium]|nr:hypothetical protein [Patescibacteria group bacterium]